MTTGIIQRITKPGFITPIDEIPTPAFAVPYAAPISKQKNNLQFYDHLNFSLAKHKAAVTPIKPKKGAEVGQVSVEEVDISRERMNVGQS
jgi:hypothetical protein